MPQPQFSQYSRVGGWLLLPLAYLLVTLLSISLLLVRYLLALFDPETLQYLLSNGQALTMQWFFSLLTTLAMWGFTAVVLWLLCRRSARFPRLFILWLLLTVLLAIKSFAFAPVSDAVALNGLAWPLLAASIFVPYIRFSQRAKATFTQ